MRQLPGYFIEPTVATDVAADSALSREEIFGPVAALQTLPDDDAIIAAANDTDFGLVSYVYTENLTTALRAVDALDCGMVGVNRGLVSNAAAPFGGIKQSRLGREGGLEGIDEYLYVEYAALNP